MNAIKYNNPQAAFEAAIKSGRLSRQPGQENYAGAYMYMGTTSAGDLFKSINYRNYLPQLAPALEAVEKLAAGTPAILAATTNPQAPASGEAEDAMKDALFDQPQHFPGW